MDWRQSSKASCHTYRRGDNPQKFIELTMPLTPDYLRARRPLRDAPVPDRDAVSLEELGSF